MPRQPVSGASAPVRASAPHPSSPLAPSRYRALRARYNALLVTLYERSTLTLREIAAVAGRTDRAVQIMVRALGCRPRHAGKCRPGTDVGVRREGSRPPRLNATATQRAVAAFAGVARELDASAQAHAAEELQRATARAARRTVRTQSRVMASAARELSHLAAAIEHAAEAKRVLAAGRKRKPAPARKPASAHTPHMRPDLRQAQERLLREQQARTWEAHAAATRTTAASAAAPPEPDPVAPRPGGIAERQDAGRRLDPRIRRL